MTYSNTSGTPTLDEMRKVFQRAIAKLRADAVDNVRQAIRAETIVIPPGTEIGTLSADGEFVPHVPGKSPHPTHVRWKETL